MLASQVLRGGLVDFVRIWENSFSAGYAASEGRSSTTSERMRVSGCLRFESSRVLRRFLEEIRFVRRFMRRRVDYHLGWVRNFLKLYIFIVNVIVVYCHIRLGLVLSE